MPIQHAVLALLADGPGHGYQLKGAFEESVGPQWGPLNIGHLYQILDRLSRDGLVTSTRVAQDVKPDRVVYAITDAGQAELAEWMESPTPRTSGFRDDFFLKVMAAAHTREADTVQTVITRQRAFLLRELHNLEQLRHDRDRRPDDLVVDLLLAAAVRHVTADQAFLDDAEERLLSDGAAALATIPSRQPAPVRQEPRPAPARLRSAS
jgi:DNA-binding PadR family transcriptional regulator